MPDQTPLNRREFGTTLLAGATVPMLAEFAGSKSAVAAPGDKPDKNAVVDKLLELVKFEHPDGRLDEAAIAEIRSELEQQVARSERLSAYPLTNADEPAFAFRAYRKV